MTIGERIRDRRRELKITQEALAKTIGSNKQLINKYERGVVVDIPIRKIEIIAEALSISPAYLVGWSSEKELKK